MISVISVTVWSSFVFLPAQRDCMDDLSFQDIMKLFQTDNDTDAVLVRYMHPQLPTNYLQ